MPFPEQEQWGGGGLCPQGCVGRKGPCNPSPLLNPLETPACTPLILQVRQVRPGGRDGVLVSLVPGQEGRPGGSVESTDTWTLCAELDPPAWPAGSWGPCWGLDLRDHRSPRGVMTQPQV